MRRLLTISAAALIISSLLIGCSRRNRKTDEDEAPEVAPNPAVTVLPPAAKKDGGKKAVEPTGKITGVDPVKKKKYDDAISDALAAVTNKKLKDALRSFELAKSYQDTDFVKSEIALLKQRIEQEQTAKETIKNIEAVLNEGKAADAARLATQALQLFGAGDDGARLTQLRLQAEALLAVQKGDDPGRFERLRKEGETALADNNLRAASVAFEQALQARDDAGLRKSYGEIHDKLSKYDSLRQKAADLRRDPTQLDDAILALKQAQDAWNTQQIRQDIDDAQRALQNRRDSVSVADFDVRNDVGMPDAGSAAADALLPLLGKKYDTVGRDKLRRVLTDLKVDNAMQLDAATLKQVGELARVRYLVVGSINRFAAVGVSARLMDTKTGLIVQTGRVAGATAQDAINMAPDLAQQLLMTEQEKLQAEQQAAQLAAQQAANANVAPVGGPLPGLPQAPVQGQAVPQMPAMLLNINLGRPGVTGFNPNFLGGFNQLPVGGLQPGMAFPGGPLDPQTQSRLLNTATQMGDLLFSSGQFPQALAQYQQALALTQGLDPTNPANQAVVAGIQARLAQTFPLAQQQAGVNQQPIGSPQLVVMPFAVNGSSAVVPPALGYATATGIAPYFGTNYNVADPSSVYYYMARSGLSMNNLANNPAALQAIGRMAGVRYFVFGNLVPSVAAPGGLDANTVLVDAELGYQMGAGRVTAQNTSALQLQLPQLAAMTMMNPQQAAAYQTQQQQLQVALNQGLAFMNAGQYPQAISVFTGVLQLQPNNGQAQYYLNQAQQLLQQQNLRMVSAQTPMNAMQQFRRLAQASTLARQNAIAANANLTPAQRQANMQMQAQAQANLLTQAQLAANANQPGLAVNLYQGALGFSPPPTMVVPPGVQFASPQNIMQSAQEVQLQANQAQQLWSAPFTDTLLQARQRQLQQAQQQLTQDRQRLQSGANPVQAAQTQFTNQIYQDRLQQGQLLYDQQNYPAALAAFQSAQRINATPQVTTLINTTIRQIALASAATPQQAQAIANQLEAEAQRKQANAEYKQLMSDGTTALNANNYNLAIKSFQSALTLRPNDPTATAMLTQAQQAQAAAQTQANYQQAMAAGQKSLLGKQYPNAIKAFNQALALVPGDTNATNMLAQVQQAQQADAAGRQQAAAAAQTRAKYQTAMTAGQRALAGRHYDDAVRAYNDALALVPNDRTAQRGLTQATQARDASRAKTPVAPAGMTYEKAMQNGAMLENQQNYAAAQASYQEAARLRPKDMEANKKSQFTSYLAQGQQHLERSQFVEATREFEAAVRLYPTNFTAANLLKKAKNRMK